MPLMQFHDCEATLEFGKKDEGKKKVLFCSEAGLLGSCSVHSLLRWGDALLALQNAFNQSSLRSAPLYFTARSFVSGDRGRGMHSRQSKGGR